MAQRPVNHDRSHFTQNKRWRDELRPAAPLPAGAHGLVYQSMFDCEL